MPFDRPLSPRTSQTARFDGRGAWSAALRSVALRVTLFSAVFGALVGCAAPGEPTARHPVVPRAVRDLAVRQEGNSVVLRFTLPSDSADGKPLGEPPAVEIYRGISAAGEPTAKKSAMRLMDTIPAEVVGSYEQDGHIEFRDALDPSEIARESGEQMSYVVRTRVARERASADSIPATLRVYPAPEPVGEVRATVVEKAIALAWTPVQFSTGAANPGVPSGYRVYRAEVDPDSAAAAVEDPSKAIPRAPLSPVGLVRAPAYQDAEFEFGRSYVYVVRSLQQFGSDTVESQDSKRVVVMAKDLFPPATPQGLVAIVVPETSGLPAYVELSWSISQEADLAGYAVYRSEQQEAPGERLNNELLPAPTFRDIKVLPGRRYFYRVRAVDHAGNESPLSDAVEADVAGGQP